MSSTLKTANGSRVVLGSGVQACNVFWRVASSATFDGNTQFVGTVIASESITFSGPGATLNGRVIAQTAAITFNNTTVNNSSCASPTPTPTATPTQTPTPTATPTPTPTPTPSSAASSSSGSSSSPSGPCMASEITTIPTILEARRTGPTSIFVRWGPYAGLNDFMVRYGYENGKWIFNTKVSGFSTTINALPTNQSIWISVAATDNCAVGNYGTPVLVGGTTAINSPGFPNAGIGPDDKNISWGIPAGVFFALIIFYLARRKYYFYQNNENY